MKTVIFAVMTLTLVLSVDPPIYNYAYTISFD